MRFDYMTEDHKAAEYIATTFGVTLRTANKAIDRACDKDTYTGRGYVVSFTDVYDETAGRIVHWVDVTYKGLPPGCEPDTDNETPRDAHVTSTTKFRVQASAWAGSLSRNSLGTSPLRACGMRGVLEALGIHPDDAPSALVGARALGYQRWGMGDYDVVLRYYGHDAMRHELFTLSRAGS